MSDPSLHEIFHAEAILPENVVRTERTLKRRKKRTPPFSLRLTEGERARLERDAGAMTLGAYVRLRLFGDNGPRSKHRMRRPVEDHASLARVLAALGQSALASNINQLAKAVHVGTLPATPDTKAALDDACADIAAIRRELMRALGKQA